MLLCVDVMRLRLEVSMHLAPNYRDSCRQVILDPEGTPRGCLQSLVWYISWRPLDDSLIVTIVDARSMLAGCGYTV